MRNRSKHTCQHQQSHRRCVDSTQGVAPSVRQWLDANYTHEAVNVAKGPHATSDCVAPSSPKSADDGSDLTTRIQADITDREALSGLPVICHHVRCQCYPTAAACLMCTTIVDKAENLCATLALTHCWCSPCVRCQRAALTATKI